MNPEVIVIDNAIADFEEYMRRLPYARFSDLQAQGIKYSDISQDMKADALYEAVEQHMGFKPEHVLQFLRAYRNRPDNPRANWIHSDFMFSDYIGIFFAQPSQFSQDDGFSLWRNKELDDIRVNSLTDGLIAQAQSSDPEQWEIWKRIEFKPNRLVICPASYYHSTATYGYSAGTLSNCRIVHVIFFNKGK